MIVMAIIMMLNDVNIDITTLSDVLITVVLIFITPVLIYLVYRPKIVISKGFVITKKGYLRFKIQNLSKFREVFDVTIYVAYMSKNVANRYFAQSVRVPYLDVKSSKKKETNYIYERIITEQQLPNVLEGRGGNIRDFFKSTDNKEELKSCVEVTVIVYDKYTSVKHSYSRYYRLENIVENGVFYDDELEPRTIPINQD